MNDYLMHHGVSGQKWGVRNGPPYPLNHTGSKSPSELMTFMSKVCYKDFSTLKSPGEVAKTKTGSCHDQAFLEYSELKRLGLNPKALFIMEYDPKTNQGGMTHTLVTFKEGGATNWVEPSSTWPERAGITAYRSEQGIKNEIARAHKSGEFGNKSTYSSILFSEFKFEDHAPGEDLQTYVDICLRD